MQGAYIFKRKQTNLSANKLAKNFPKTRDTFSIYDYIIICKCMLNFEFLATDSYKKSR